MACRLCTERGKTWSGDDPRCAFETGIFDTNNWNCATMSRLRDISRQLHTETRDDMACASIGYVPLSNDYADGDMDAGYIVMTWYKDRGRTGQALIMWDDNEPRPLTLREAEEAIRCFERLRGRAYNVYSTVES